MAVTSFVISFYASARSLQVGLPIEVIAITSVTANLAAILGGILIFGESIGSGAIGITGRMLAFLLVIGAAAMIPAPLRLEAARPNPGDDADPIAAEPQTTTTLHGRRPQRNELGRLARCAPESRAVNDPGVRLDQRRHLVIATCGSRSVVRAVVDETADAE